MVHLYLSKFKAIYSNLYTLPELGGPRPSSFARSDGVLSNKGCDISGWGTHVVPYPGYEESIHVHIADSGIPIHPSSLYTYLQYIIINKFCQVYYQKYIDRGIDKYYYL